MCIFTFNTLFGIRNVVSVATLEDSRRRIRCHNMRIIWCVIYGTAARAGAAIASYAGTSIGPMSGGDFTMWSAGLRNYMLANSLRELSPTTPHPSECFTGCRIAQKWFYCKWLLPLLHKHNRQSLYHSSVTLTWPRLPVEALGIFQFHSSHASCWTRHRCRCRWLVSSVQWEKRRMRNRKPVLSFVLVVGGSGGGGRWPGKVLKKVRRTSSSLRDAE